MLVVDASVLVARVIARPAWPELVARLDREAELHVPHLVDVEALHTLRRLVRRGALSAEQASQARGDLRALNLQRYPHVLLLDRAWELRDSLSAYDAVFVALAEALDVPLVTVDARLAAATGHRATVELL